MGGLQTIRAIWENGGGYVGLECRTEGRPFAYWIGMFTPRDTPVPDGFSCIDFEAAALGTCWIRGTEEEVHDTSRCREALEKEGLRIASFGHTVYSFENCLCPRYTTPDKNGNVILDYCYYVE